MLVLISWRNVWRNKIRSLVLVSSIALGIWAGIFIMAFSQGMGSQYVNIAIKGQISHIQIHNPEYKKDKKIRFTIPGSQNVVRKLGSVPEIKALSCRTIVNGMISSAVTGSGIHILGVDPEKENSVTEIKTNLIEGDYFADTKRNQVLIGEKLSKKLNVKLRNKIILTFQDINGNITSGAFRVVGIYKTRNSSFDDANVFVKRTELNSIVGLDAGTTHEIAILLRHNNDLQRSDLQIKKMFPGLLVENWQEIAPELKFVTDSFGQTMYLFITIILLALTFGIINTMLMSVLERVRELGILMAIGMNKFKIFFMVILETLYIALIGGPLGITLAYMSVSYFGKAGISLSAFAKGLSSYGMDSTVYPALSGDQYLNILIMVLIASILAAIYPSIKALKLKPVHAIRKI